MKKTLLTFAALLLTAGLASAQYPPSGYAPGPVMPASYGGMSHGGHGIGGGGFGLGLFSGIFSNHGGGGRGARNVNVLPIATTGQLAFPQNPFVRSPRDFFMYEGRGR